MALRQAARTGRTPLPERWPDSPPYAFAVRIVEVDARAVVVLCPWCGQEHTHAVPFEQHLEQAGPVIALCAEGRYLLTVPAGTPVLVPAA